MTDKNCRESSRLLEIDVISAINCFDLAPEFETKENHHASWEFVYVDAGRIRCRCGEREAELLRGQMVFHRPGEVHSTVCNGRESAAIISVLFECNSPRMEFFSERILSVPDALMPIFRAFMSEGHKNYVVSEYPLKPRGNAPIDGDQVLRNYLEILLILLMRGDGDGEDGGIEEGTPRSGKHLSSEICEYLKEHVCERITLDMLSEKFHFGKVYLCDVFKKDMGCTIMNYHLDLKMTEAKRLLRETGTSISEISERLGFESQSYFSRCFKRRVGYSPQSFRQMLINSYAVRR